ncbi:MAG: hypothetical protein ACRDJV_07845 [Actinomycetota bacterium]
MVIAAIDWTDEIARAAITFAFVAVLGGAAGVLWARARHRRELDLAALARFYDVYGAWFATWKVWSALREAKLPEGERGELLKQAAVTEGQFEALLIKIAIERRLSDAEVSRLGRFREGYQQLRESIETGVELPFRVQYNDDERSAYMAFKSLSVEFATLLGGRSLSRTQGPFLLHKTWGRPTLPQSQRAFVEVTSWRVSGTGPKRLWWRDPGGDSVDKAVEAWQKLPHGGP